jgi:hypothetical protein
MGVVVVDQRVCGLTGFVAGFSNDILRSSRNLP